MHIFRLKIIICSLKYEGESLLLHRIYPVCISNIFPKKQNQNQMNVEQRGMLSLIWKESFRNSGSRWSAASQARLMLVHRFALSDNNKHMPVLVQGWVCEAPPSTEGIKTANTATATAAVAPHCEAATISPSPTVTGGCTRGSPSPLLSEDTDVNLVGTTTQGSCDKHPRATLLNWKFLHSSSHTGVFAATGKFCQASFVWSKIP